MFTNTDSQRQSALMALETTVASARSGFACLFSSADEYEHALISERRAQGRYGRPSRIPLMMFVGLLMVVAGTALLLL
jgi:hypothetical protein